MKKFFVLLLCVLALSSIVIPGASAAEVVVRDDLGKYFKECTGTFVLYDSTNDTYIIYNEEQSKKSLPPCSTFKIYNSLIGLETGVLNQEDTLTLVKWSEKKYANPAWNQDHTLASATRESAVWYFQELAARIGQERMDEYLGKIGYGNQDTSGGLTTFWLQSSLRISAIEQVQLLDKLYSGQLPFSAANVEIVKRNITLGYDNGVRLMGKTGSGLEDGKLILGWFVGSIEKEGKHYIFATNIEAPNGAYGGKAREITLEIAKALGIMQ